MKRILGAHVAAVALLIGACGGPAGTITGSINIDGSSTVFPIVQAVAEEFNREEPRVKVSVGVSGTGGGFKKFCAGETDISNASRPIKPSEIEECTRAKVEYLELRVAIDGLTVTVNPDNDFVECLTVAELKRIWEPRSRINNWRQVRPSFPDRPLTLYGAGTDSGTFDYFTEAIVGETGASRSDYTASEDDNVLVQGVAGDPNALAYFGHAYAEENADIVKIVAVDGGDGCIKPTVDAIREGIYAPLARPLFVYVARAPSARVEVRAFVDFMLEVAGELARDVGYVALPDAARIAERQKWDAFTS